jgi:predicted O-methyltransferase YrrM
MTCAAHRLATTRHFLTLEDVDLIQHLVRSLPGALTIADIGAGSGTTALAVMCANPAVKLWTVDVSQENLDWAKLALRNAGFIETKFCLGDAAASAAIFDDSEFDMVMLDTSHEYEATKREIRAWLPKLREEGTFWLHDYRGEYGVRTAVEEAVAEKLLVPYILGGLGWSGVKRTKLRKSK